MSHTGNLHEDSPGVCGALKRVLSTESFGLMVQVYKSAALCGAIEEFPINREPEASFNPKPARICQILLKEGAETDSKILAAAMLCCAKTLPETELIPGTHALARQVVDSSTSEPTQILRIRLALIIDEIRHLHMSSLTGDELIKIILRAKSIIASSLDPVNARLKKVAENAVVNIEELHSLSLE